jgi:glycosyltransferase involved in cell wall biosynthesis
LSVHAIHLAEDDLSRLRIAYLSPLPPERSGIADYSRELLPYLARHVDVTLFAARPTAVDESVRVQFPVRELDHFPAAYQQFDLALYHMGNSEYHEPFFPLLIQYPGVVVLHDYSIHHFIFERTIGRGDFTGYAREMGYALGIEGMYLAQAVDQGRMTPPVFEVPLNDRLLDASLGLIVHSEYVVEKVRQQGYGRPLRVIQAQIEARPGKSRREKLALPDDSLLFGSFGLITAHKQIGMALRAFRRLREKVPNAHYLLVGDALPDVGLESMIDGLELGEVVHHVGYTADLDRFVDWLYTTDVVINLRYPTMGETSATALRAMAAGKPLIVFDHGWYSEIPNEAAIRVSPMDEDGLLEAMIQLAQAPEVRLQMGRAGLVHTASASHPETVAEVYASELRSILAQRRRRYG